MRMTESNMISLSAESFIGRPARTIRGEVAVFDADSHVFVDHEAQAGKRLIRKHNICITSVQGDVIDCKMVHIQNRSRATNTRANIGADAIPVWQMQFRIHQERHIFEVAILAPCGISDSRNPVRINPNFSFEAKPIAYIITGGETGPYARIESNPAPRPHGPKELQQLNVLSHVAAGIGLEIEPIRAAIASQRCESQKRNTNHQNTRHSEHSLHSNSFIWFSLQLVR